MELTQHEYAMAMGTLALQLATKADFTKRAIQQQVIIPQSEFINMLLEWDYHFNPKTHAWEAPST